MAAKKKKILMIEDEPMLVEMYRLYLEKSGFEVLCASDGQTGIELAKQKIPDLILLDILMPAQDGWEVIKILKSGAETRGIPVVFFSNFAQIEEIEKGLRLGADDYIVKAELTPKELAEKVSAMLGYSDKAAEAGDKKRILIIDAEREPGNWYKKNLEKDNFETEIAKSGGWGLRLAKMGNFSAILINAAAPNLVLEEAVKDLKRDPRTKKVPLLVFSRVAPADEGEIKKIIDLGVADYFIAAKVGHDEIIREIKKLTG